MWQNYGTLADQRLRELHADADARRAMPKRARRHVMPREVIGRALVRLGERLVGTAGARVAHR